MHNLCIVKFGHTNMRTLCDVVLGTLISIVSVCVVYLGYHMAGNFSGGFILVDWRF